MKELETVIKRLRSGEISRAEFICRSLSLGVSLSSVGLILGACGGNEEGRGEDSSGILKIGIYSYIPEAIAFDQIVRNYEAENPGIKIKVSPLPGSEIADVPQVVQRYSLEARQGKATYDLIMGTTPWLEVAPLIEADAVAPLDEYLPEDLVSAMPESVRKQHTYKDGKIYDMPFWTDVVGFLYRRDYLKRATGSEEPPTTWNEVLSAAKEVREKLGSEGISAYGADWAYAHRMFLPLLVTLTDKPYTDDGLWNLEGNAALEALAWIKKLYPFMPENSQQDLGSSETFQAGKLAMATYWQAQRARAITAGIPEDKIGLAPNPKNDFNSTVFWTTSAVVQAASENKEKAVKFLVEGFLKNKFAIKESYKTQKIIPYDFVSEIVSLPEWAKPLVEQIEVGQPIPQNSAFLNVEQPIYQEEVQKMLLRGQPLRDTRDNMLRRIKQEVNN